MKNITCPKHDTGGGPCYCNKTPSPPLRKFTLTTEGGHIVVIAVSYAEAIDKSGDPKVISSKSEPWPGPVTYKQAAEMNKLKSAEVLHHENQALKAQVERLRDAASAVLADYKMAIESLYLEGYDDEAEESLELHDTLDKVLKEQAL